MVIYAPWEFAHDGGLGGGLRMYYTGKGSKPLHMTYLWSDAFVSGDLLGNGEAEKSNQVKNDEGQYVVLFFSSLSPSADVIRNTRKIKKKQRR